MVIVVKIRLHRFGKTKKPFYRIVVVDSRKRRDGAYIESVGFYNPVATEKEELYRINLERAEYWLNQGAWPTDTVLSLFKKAGVKLPKFIQKEQERKVQERIKSQQKKETNVR
jgi:small subunit ribosomal protein S16